MADVGRDTALESSVRHLWHLYVPGPSSISILYAGDPIFCARSNDAIGIGWRSAMFGIHHSACAREPNRNRKALRSAMLLGAVIAMSISMNALVILLDLKVHHRGSAVQNVGLLAEPARRTN